MEDSIPNPIVKTAVKAKKWPIVMMAIVAMAGVGAGATGLLSAKQLQEENQKLAEKVKALGGDAQGGDRDTGDTSGKDNTTTKDYIFFNQWGVKVKIPEELRLVNYLVKENAVCFTGMKKAGDEQKLPEFTDITKNAPGMGCIVRYLKNDENTEAGKLLTIDKENELTKGYKFVALHPQAYYSQNAKEQAMEEEAWKLVSEMTTKNFSAL